MATSGVLEVVIDASGTVESTTIRVQVSVHCDLMAMAVATRSRAVPAAVEGLPVRLNSLKYIRVITITSSTALALFSAVPRQPS